MLFIARIIAGGGSSVDNDIAWPGSASIELHQGDSDGYLIIEIGEEDEDIGSPGPGGKSNKKEGEKKKGKGGKTAQAQLFQ